MPRPKSKPGKCGRKPWIFGTKVPFFEAAKDEWMESCKAKTNTQWSRAMAIRYYIAYGDLDLKVCLLLLLQVSLTVPKEDLETTPPMPTDGQVTKWEEDFAQEIAALSLAAAKEREDEVLDRAKVCNLLLFRERCLRRIAEDSRLVSSYIREFQGQKGGSHPPNHDLQHGRDEGQAPPHPAHPDVHQYQLGEWTTGCRQEGA